MHLRLNLSQAEVEEEGLVDVAIIASMGKWHQEWVKQNLEINLLVKVVAQGAWDLSLDIQLNKLLIDP
jgi:hypothetical protein